MSKENTKTEESASLTAELLREHLCEQGPIYAPVHGLESTAMLTVNYEDGFQLVMENNDVGGGPAVDVTDEFALAWALEFEFDEEFEAGKDDRPWHDPDDDENPREVGYPRGPFVDEAVSDGTGETPPARHPDPLDMHGACDGDGGEDAY